MSALPGKLNVEVVSQEGLLLREEVDEIVVPGAEGYFGVRPGHAPLLAVLGVGSLSIHAGARRQVFTIFGGFCEVLPERVIILAEVSERGEDIDPVRAEQALRAAAERMKTIRDEAGYAEARESYQRAVTRLAVAKGQRDHSR